MPTLFTVTIDTEEEWDWNAGWPTTGLSVTNVPHLAAFQDLCEGYKVAPTYFTNRAVLDDPAARKALLELATRERVEIGMHIHPWNTPPLTNGPVRARDTYLHNYPDEIIHAKLKSVYDRFLEEGLRPTSFRGGRFSCGPVVQDFLRDRGFVAEASVVPFTSWPDDGAPDYRDRDLRPRRLPPRHVGEQALWEIPLTLAWTRQPHQFWRRCYACLERSWLRHLRLIGLAERAGLVRRVWLNFETTPAADMIALLQALRPLGLPCVCFLVHSSSLTAGPGPYCRNRADQEQMFARIESVFKVLSGWDDFHPATVTEVANQLESQHHASPGYQPA
jgi:hypothetical protein